MHGILGAIIGDIVGSRFEYRNCKSKDFDFYSDRCRYTDDTVMTCAVADALKFNKDIVCTLQEYGRNYSHRGYGGNFSVWIHSENPQPYNSWGNGAAMRVSSVAYIAKSPEEVKELSKRVTEITHNHPEGIKGAETVAMCVYMACHGADKEAIRAYATEHYPEIANFDYEDLVKNYSFDVSCQGSVPQAIFCFLIGTDFVDCIRTAISIGGDSDTIGAITGSIAGAYYGLSTGLLEGMMEFFPTQHDRKLFEPILKYCEDSFI